MAARRGSTRLDAARLDSVLCRILLPSSSLFLSKSGINLIFDHSVWFLIARLAEESATAHRKPENKP